MRGPEAAGGFASSASSAGALSAGRARFVLAGRTLELTSDDPALLAETAALLGAPSTAAETPADLRAALSLHDDGSARLHLEMADPAHLTPADLLLAAESDDFPFTLLQAEGARATFSRRGSGAPALMVDGGEVRLVRAEGWRKAVALLLLQRIMRSRDDAIFLHAASVALHGRGLLLVGPKGAGKSTLALALAARGHALLGDENACLLPARHALLPFRRPVGVKPGPRAAAVERALAARGLSPERDGMMRLPAGDLAPGVEPAAVPLAFVVFLCGFAPASRLRALAPGRSDVGRLQAVGASMVNAPPARRAFEMARALAASRVYELEPGPPDEAASVLEEALSAA